MASLMFWIGLFLIVLAIGRGLLSVLADWASMFAGAPMAGGDTSGSPIGLICLIVGIILMVLSFFVPGTPAHAASWLPL